MCECLSGSFHRRCQKRSESEAHQVGISKAGIFIWKNMVQKMDPLKAKDELYAQKSVDKLYEELIKTPK